jgi:heme/copper-type cytochrome/quinol oxidase subunit 2
VKKIWAKNIWYVPIFLLIFSLVIILIIAISCKIDFYVKLNKNGSNKEGMKMRRVFKIILVVFAAIIIIVGVFAAVIFLDPAAYTANGSQTLTPSGASIGKALVIYDPGLSGTAKGVADKVASDLQAKSSRLPWQA